MNEKKTLLVAIAGLPNAGKSTFVNYLLAQKLSIVTPKAQTTRRQVWGALMIDATQIVLIDTPGLLEKPSRPIERIIHKNAWSGVRGAELVLFLIDPNITRPYKNIIKGLGHSNVVILINKIDKFTGDLQPLIDELQESGKIFKVSAATGAGVAEVLEFLKQSAKPAEEWLFEADNSMGVSVEFLAAETTREKLFLLLQKELPYELTVITDSIETNPADKSLTIEQTIFVKNNNHKMIVLGRGGGQIKRIGRESREELEILWNKRIHLFLYVKVKEDWLENAEKYINAQ